MGAERPGVNGNMKEGIHPEYVECQVACACGESFTTRATKPELRVDICSECHPFFSGQQKMVDTEGRVEQFIRRYGLQDRYSQDESSEENTSDGEQ